MKKVRHLISLICVCAIVSSTSVYAVSESSIAPFLDTCDQEQLASMALDIENEVLSQAAIARLNDMALNEAHEKTLNAAAGYGYAVENYTSTVKRSFAPIWGRYGTAFPQGTSESVDVSISISAGAILPDGYTLDVSTSVSKSHQLSGPSYNTKVPGSSLNATHSIAIGVLSGTIIYESFDYVDTSTGEIFDHVSQYSVGNPVATSYTLLVSDIYPHYYVGHASKNSYRDFSSLYNYKKHLESSNVMQAYNW